MTDNLKQQLADGYAARRQEADKLQRALHLLDDPLEDWVSIVADDRTDDPHWDAAWLLMDEEYKWEDYDEWYDDLERRYNEAIAERDRIRRYADEHGVWVTDDPIPAF